MRKRLPAFVCALLMLPSVAFAAGGVMSGQKNIRCVSTEYFDIIFSDQSEVAAEELFLHADSICESVCAGLGIPLPDWRMPVVVTAAVDGLNAYFTNYNYNHIVLYDALPPEELEVFSDTILGVFRHELTHALTVNMRNPFWRTVGSVFGDLLNWGCYVTMPPLIKEGAAVASESSEGEGRLSDGFFLHTVRQAKLQGRFFSYADVTGARDVYPKESLSYAFGGTFTAWLQERYGMETYAQFWYAAVNMRALTYAGAFRRAYGKRLSDVWAEFRESVWVPDIPSDPLADAAVLAFLPMSHNAGSSYESLSSSARGIAFVETQTQSVWFCISDDKGALLPARKLFSKDGLLSASLSADGAYLSVSFISYNGASPESRCALWCMETGSLVSCPVRHVYASAVCMSGDEAVLVCLQKDAVTLCRIQQDLRGKILVRPFATLPFPGGFSLSSPCPASDGSAAFLGHKDGKTSVLILSLRDLSFSEIPVPLSGASVRSLSYAQGSGSSFSLSFAWATADSFPRLGLLSADGGHADFSFMARDVSGGIYATARIPSATDSESFVYAADFVEERKLLVLDASRMEFFTAASETVPLVTASVPSGEETGTVLPAKKWGHLYYNRGTLLPLTNISIPDGTGAADSRIVFPGLTWMTNNAWDSDSLVLSAGINPGGGFLSPLQSESFQAAFLARFSGGTGTGLFSYDAQALVVLGSAGFESASADVTLSGTLFSGDVLSLSARNRTFLYASVPQLSALDTAVLQLSGIRQCGPGTFELGGVALQCTATVSSGPDLSFLAYPAVIIRIPRLLPFSSPLGLTCNLPVRVQLLFFPSAAVPFDMQVDTVLFSWDMERGIPFLPVFMNRIVLCAGYELMRFGTHGAEEWWDMVHAELALQPSVNTGAAAYSSGFFTLGLSMQFYPRAKEDSRWAASFTTSLKF